MKVFFCFVCAALSGSLFAADSNVGSQAATWLNLPNSARSAAMGGASVALADDVDTVSVNPAGLGAQAGQSLSLMNNSYVQGTYMEHLAYGLGIGSKDGLAAALNYINYGAISTSTVVNGVLQPTGSAVTPYGESFDLGYGHAFAGIGPFGDLLVGATLELVDENLTGGATNAALGTDLGILWRQSALEGLSAGLGLQNLGSQLDEANLPLDYRVGLGYRLLVPDQRQALAFAVDLEVPEADAASEALSLGAEYTGNSQWAVRAGYKFVGNGGVGGLSVGGGLTYKIASIDYAFVSEGVLGDANQISVSAKF